MSYSVKEVNDMYRQWKNSGTDEDFAKFWNLNSQDLIEIADSLARARGAYKDGT